MGIPAIISSVPAQTPYIQYIATSGQTVFPYPFVITQDSDLIVVDNGSTLQTDQGYTLSGVGNSNGGNVTFTTGATAGDIITLYRDIPIERLTQIGQNSGFSSTAFNAEYNNIYLILQQLEEQFAQCLQIPVTNTASGSGTLLTPSLYAGKYLSFDSNGNPQPALLTSSGSITSSLIQSLLTQQIVGGFTNPVSAAETAASVTPTYYIYSASPRIDPRRYGALGDGSTTDTTAMQTALNVAKAGKGRICLPDSFNSICGPLSLTFSGNRSNESLAIEGMSPNGSKITALNASGALLTIAGNTPTGNPTEMPIILENFGMNGFSTSADILQLTAVSYFRVSGVFFAGTSRKCMYLFSALTGLIDQVCSFNGSTYGIYARTDSTGAAANLLKVRDNIFAGATAWAVDYDQGSELQMCGNDIEQNAGAIHIGGNINVSPAFGFAKVMLENNWIEANSSGFSVLVDAPGLSQLTNITLRGGHIISAPSGQALKVLGAHALTIEDFYSPSPGDTWNLTATSASIKNAQVATLTDTGITYPTYTNVTTSAANFRSGRDDSYTSSITGCATAPTGSQVVNLQGNVATLQFVTPVSATSNSTALTLTGLPSKYYPLNDTTGVITVIDAGVNVLAPCTISGSTGVITVNHTFTSSGTKGVFGGTVPFRIK